MSRSDAIERYLFTGEHDPMFAAWSGGDSKRRREGTEALLGVLVRVVEYRSRRAPLRASRSPANPGALVAERITGLLHGLLPAHEAAHLCTVLPARVEVVTPRSFSVQSRAVSLDTAWRLANLLLDDLGAPPLSDDTPTIDGVCAHGRAWVTPRAFSSTAPYSDVVVHEVAHLLHDLTRGEVGLTPADQPVIAVPPCARETFAYAAEVWSWLTRSRPDLATRRQHMAAYLRDHVPVDFRVDPARLAEALFSAVEDPICGWRHVRATANVAPAVVLAGAAG